MWVIGKSHWLDGQEEVVWACIVSHRVVKTPLFWFCCSAGGEEHKIVQ
jgi:hypothetical protein